MTDQTCPKWFAKFRAGDFSLDDDTSQLGGPGEVDIDDVETLIENSQCYITQEIADILKISNTINLLVKMKITPFILQKKLNRLFGQPNIITWNTL